MEEISPTKIFGKNFPTHIFGKQFWPIRGARRRLAIVTLTSHSCLTMLQYICNNETKYLLFTEQTESDSENQYENKYWVTEDSQSSYMKVTGSYR